MYILVYFGFYILKISKSTLYIGNFIGRDVPHGNTKNWDQDFTTFPVKSTIAYNKLKLNEMYFSKNQHFRLIRNLNDILDH